MPVKHLEGGAFFCAITLINLSVKLSKLEFALSQYSVLFSLTNWELSIFNHQLFAFPFFSQNIICFCLIKNYIIKTN